MNHATSRQLIANLLSSNHPKAYTAVEVSTWVCIPRSEAGAILTDMEREGDAVNVDGHYSAGAAIMRGAEA